MGGCKRMSFVKRRTITRLKSDSTLKNEQLPLVRGLANYHSSEDDPGILKGH